MTIKIKSLLIEKSAEDNTLSGVIAKVANCKVPAINKFKNDENREFENFTGLVEMVKYLNDNFCHGKDEFKLMIDYAQQLDPNKKTARYMLEYLDSHMLTEAKRELLGRMLNSSNNESIQWAILYDIDDKVSRKDVEPFAAIKELNKAKTSSIELEIISSIFMTYIYMDQKVYNQAFNMINEELTRVEEVKDEFIRKMFKCRLQLLKAEYHGRKNEMKECRELCNDIIANIVHDSKLAQAYLHLGNSHIITSYDDAMACFNNGLALKYAHTKIKDSLKSSSNFVNNTWNKTPEYLDHNSKSASDIHEIVFSEINKKNFEQAADKLKSINLSKCNENELAFHYYLRGLLSNSIEDYTESIIYFRKSGDVYFRQLSVNKLAQFNLPTVVLKALLSE